MPKILPDLTGQKRGRLQILRSAGTDSKRYKIYECLCDCGTTKQITASSLARGDVQSCGCLLQEKRNGNIKKAQESSKTHGLSGTWLYQTWNSAFQRCYNHKHPNFYRYGGAGVGFCDYIRQSPANLLEVVGQRPQKHHSLDRIDGKLGYTCGKCENCLKMGWPMNIRWATPSEQANNRKDSVWITINGVRKTCGQWAKEMGKSYNYVRRNFRADDGTMPAH